MQVYAVSAKTGEGMEQWLRFLVKAMEVAIRPR
jgi:hypothetical protein